tara:strand:+ start:2178 stop:4127 length:1950 start_codon:yes stop_codon:yes gene_type:complete
MAKGFNVSEMFGMLPDLVMQGFSSPEDILNIAETGQPVKVEPIDFPMDNPPEMPEGNIWEMVMGVTGDPMLANMAASEDASGALAQAILTDLTPSDDTIKIESAAQAVLNETDYATTTADQQVVRGMGDLSQQDIIEAYANSFGVRTLALKNSVNRMVKQKEVDDSSWWQTQEGAMYDGGLYEPVSYIADPNATLEEAYSDAMASNQTTPTPHDSAALIKGMSYRVPSDTITHPTSFGKGTITQYQTPENAALRAGVTKPEADDEAFLLATPDNLQKSKYDASNNPFLNQYIDPAMSAPANLTDPNVTDTLLTTIKKSEQGAPPVLPVSSVPTTTPESEGSLIDFGTERYNSVTDSIRTRAFGNMTDMLTLGDGTVVQQFIDPNTQTLYNISNPSRPGEEVKLWDAGTLTLQNEGEVENSYTLDNDIWSFNKLHNVWRKNVPGSGTTAMANITESMPSTSHLFGKTPTEQWDILRAQEMGKDAYNPVLWDARRYGLRPSYGEFLLSGTLADGQSVPFHEWIPSKEGRDASQDWNTLVQASQLASDPYGFGGIDANDPMGRRLGFMQSLMQGDAAKTNILNMVATAMGAGEGYGSDQMRAYLGRLYDVYEADVAGKGKPVGGFASWIDDRRIAEPATVDRPTQAGLPPGI